MRCYFNLENGGSSIPDEEGVEVADSRRALHQALMDVLDVLYREPDRSEWDGWKLRVTDRGGNLLFFVALDGQGAALSELRQASSVPTSLVQAGATAEDGPKERRQDKRDRTFGRGRILPKNGRSGVDCIIQDLSPRGARLSVPTGVNLPDEVSLYLAKEDRTARARIRWFTADQLGIEFLDEGQEGANDEVAERSARATK
jgi:Domain of unknown function (DUF6894)/PilZ domain